MHVAGLEKSQENQGNWHCREATRSSSAPRRAGLCFVGEMSGSWMEGNAKNKTAADVLGRALTRDHSLCEIFHTHCFIYRSPMRLCFRTHLQMKKVSLSVNENIPKTIQTRGRTYTQISLTWKHVSVTCSVRLSLIDSLLYWKDRVAYLIHTVMILYSIS